MDLIVGLNLVYPMHSCVCAHRRLCACLHNISDRASTWPHLFLVLWQQAVIIFIFCGCSLQTLPLRSGSVWNPFIVTTVWHWQCVRGPASSREKKNPAFLFIFSLFMTFSCYFCFLLLPGALQVTCNTGARRGIRFNWGCETDKTQLLADATLEHFLTPAEYRLQEISANVLHRNIYIYIFFHTIWLHRVEVCCALVNHPALSSKCVISMIDSVPN